MKKFNPVTIDSEGVKGTVLFERATGSRLYGTSYEKGEHPFDPDYVSDYDYQGLFLIDPLHKLKLAPFNNYQPILELKEFDSHLYEIEKFFFEAGRNNPSYMDIIFGDENSLVGKTQKADLILDNKKLFICNKVADSFDGYASSQLQRIKLHYKWVQDFPDIEDVENTIKNAYEKNEVDHNIIASLFSGSLAYDITKEDPNKKKIKSSLTIHEFFIKYFSNKNYDVSRYIKPHVLEYIILKDNLGHTLKINEEIKYFLINNAAYKENNQNIYFIYDGGNGLFSQDRFFKSQRSEGLSKNSDVKYVAFLNHTKYQNDIKGIQDLWSWRVNRNKKRSALEKQFGYDVKHGMHTYRLLNSATNIIKEGSYNPRLKGSDLQDAKDILSGKWEYRYFLSEVEKKRTELRTLKNKNLLPKEIDQKKLAEIYNEILFS